MPIFPFFTSAVWPLHVSPLLRVHPRFRVWPLCSSLSEVIYSFCSLSIRPRFRTKSYNTFFSSSPFGSHDRSFDPSVVDEDPALAMGTFSFGIVAFSKFASFGVSFFYLIISPFVLDESSTSASLSKFSNFSFSSLIRFRTLYLSAIQFFVEWPGFSAW